MPARTVTHSAEAQAVATFLALAAVEPSALVVEGVAGIGKTTLWLAAQEQARQRGFQVLSARAAAAESVLAYAALADLLGDVDPAAFAHLPHPQRLALDRVLQWADTDGPVINQNAVAAGFLSLVQRIADEKPVLVAIDDVQWLDPSAVRVLAFAARRLSRAAGLLLTVRTDADSGLSVSWLQLPRPDGIRRIRVPPLSLAGLHAVLTQQLGARSPGPRWRAFTRFRGATPSMPSSLGARWTVRAQRRSAPRCRPMFRCRAASQNWCGHGSAASTPPSMTRCWPSRVWPRRPSNWWLAQPTPTP